jgi:hypothetical protein
LTLRRLRVYTHLPPTEPFQRSPLRVLKIYRPVFQNRACAEIKLRAERRAGSEKKLAGMDCRLSTRAIVQEELVHGIKLTLKVFDLV